MTVMGWFNFEGTLPGQQTGQIITKYQWFTRQRNFRVACEEGALEVAVWYGPELPDFVQMRVPVTEQCWRHFAFTISSRNEFKLYLDGCLMEAKQLPSPMQLGEQPIRIVTLSLMATFCRVITITSTGVSMSCASTLSSFLPRRSSGRRSRR